MEKVYSVRTEEEQVRIFCQFAAKYVNDFDLPEMSMFRYSNLQRIFDFVISKYTFEEGEQILRPLFFYRIGGDCDDGFIFWTAYLLWGGISKDDILVCEAREPDSDSYTHIFSAFINPTNKKKIWLDNLPGCKFNRLDYPMSQVRVTKLSEYI